jgi:hypothetical protein
MSSGRSHWTEAKAWVYRGYQAKVAPDGHVELRKSGSEILRRFPATVTHKELIEFITATEVTKGRGGK